MSIRANRHMLGLLGRDPEFHEPNSEPVPHALLDELREGFKEVDGCVVPASFQAKSIWSQTRPRADNIDDETGFECSISKVHLEEFMETNVPFSELARMGCAYAMYLQQTLLGSQVSRGRFRIIVDAQISDAEKHMGNMCSARFHKVRPNQVWLADDLESYKENALLVFEFEKGSDFA